jgi:OOP family OmpA-OmpF porin
MRPFILAIALFSTAPAIAPSVAIAAPNDGITGAYVRVDIGRSDFRLSSATPRSNPDDQGQVIKLFGGYRFNENLGVELGVAALGSIGATVEVAGQGVDARAKGRAVFGVATGRLPLGESFALHGRLGLSAGKVSGSDGLPPSDSPLGSRTSAMAGLGVEYRPRPHVALTFGYDDYGRLSRNAKASAVLLGLHVTL